MRHESGVLWRRQQKPHPISNHPNMLEKFFKSEAEPDPVAVQQQKEIEAQKTLDTELQQVAGLQDQAPLAELALQSAFTKVRQAAADKISESALLHEVEKSSQDKSVQHIVREKIKQQKQAQSEQQQAQQAIEDIARKLESLAKSSHSPLFKQQYQHLIKAWDEHGSTLHLAAKAKEQAHFDAAKVACDKILAEFAEEDARLEAAREAERVLAAEREAQKILSVKTAEEKKIEQEQLLLEKQQGEEKKKQHDKQQNQLELGLKGILAAIEVLLQDGQVNQAAKKLKNAQSKLESLDKKIAAHYENPILLLQKRINELRDWQGFAALPKKQELCEKMQQLVGVELPPPALADAIHELQEQWKALKGGLQAEEQKLWLQFKESADKAYEPCKQYFEQLRSLRAENLRQRENICNELENYFKANNWAALESNSGDWKAVDKIVETAKNEFHRFSPVDHKQLNPIKERFDAALKPIIEKLRAEQKLHENQKQQLIDQAKKLLEQADVQVAIDGAKKLQQQWKVTGVTRQREDQKLWQQFRSACDAVFARRDAEKLQATASLQQDIAKAEDLCKQIEALAAQDDNELQKSREQYQLLRSQFLSIDTLSKEKQQKLFRVFYKTCDHYQERVAGIKDRKQQSAMQEAFTKANLCAQLENGSLSADEGQTQWAALSAALSTEHNTVLEKRFANALKIARGETKTDFTANDKARRVILIRLEMLKNQETPAEDKPLRMEFSLKQLSGGLGKKPADPKLELQTLTLEWLGCAIGLPEHREKLQQRFDALVK